MKLSEIKKIYRVHELDDQYLVYNKEFGSSIYSNYKYLCNLEKNGGKFKIVGSGIWFDEIKSLQNAINSYVDSLPFNCEFYNPQYRKGYFESAVVHEYLRERCFKYLNSYFGFEYYNYKPENIYGGFSNEINISFHGLDYYSDKISETVEINLEISDFKWISVKVKREASEIIKGIDQLLKPLLLTDGIQNVQQSDKFNLAEFTATMNIFDPNSMNKYSKEYKAKLKEKLQQMIEAL